MKVAIIGAGVLGTALGLLLKRAGHDIVAVCSRNRRNAQTAVSYIGAGQAVGNCGMTALGADVVILAVPDRAIPSVGLEVAAGGALKRGASVLHLAGGLPAGILSGVRAAGGHRGAMHPLQSFADVDAAVRMLPATSFFIEGDPQAVERMRELVVALDGRPILIEPAAKALYHAGAAAASNFLVTLVDYAVALLSKAGIPRDVALSGLLPLIKGTVTNLEEVGLPGALTGPIARGDVGTVKRHLRALEQMPDPDAASLYRILARNTVRIALEKGSLDAEAADRILALIAEGESGGE